MHALIPSPSSSQFSIGPATFHFYALCIIAGIATAIWLGRKRYSANGGLADDVSEAAIWAVPFGIIGGRSQGCGIFGKGLWIANEGRKNFARTSSKS
jgi:prolipoprotein diacylglyceryltransferase